MCVDPATAMAVASVTATVGEGVLSYAQGQATDKAYKQAARQELLSTAHEEAGLRREQRKFAANQRLAALATGGDVASGSISAVLDDDVQTMELNALMRRYAGETRASELRFQGSQAQRMGTIMAGGKLLQAGVEAIGSGSFGDFAGFAKGGQFAKGAKAGGVKVASF